MPEHAPEPTIVMPQAPFVVLGSTAAIQALQNTPGYRGGVYVTVPDVLAPFSLLSIPASVRTIYVEHSHAHVRFLMRHAHRPEVVDRDLVFFDFHGTGIGRTVAIQPRRLAAAAAMQPFALDAPKVVHINLTSRCNLYCVMCDIHDGRPRRVTLQFDQLSSLSAVRNAYIMMTGGEPMLHERFIDICRHLSDAGNTLAITSNMTLVTDELARRMAELNFGAITISLDSAVPSTFERIRKGAKAEKVFANIRRLRDAFQGRGTFFAINMVVMRSNMDELIEMAEFAEAAGIDHVNFSNMVVKRAEALDESLDPCWEEVERRLDAVAEHVLRKRMRVSVANPHFARPDFQQRHPGRLVEPNTIVSEHPLARPFDNRYRTGQIGSHPGMPGLCVSPYGLANITPDGSVNLCREWVIGNVNEQSFEEIWSGPNAGFVREFLRHDRILCESCDHYRYCLDRQSPDIDHGRGLVSYRVEQRDDVMEELKQRRSAQQAQAPTA